MLLQLFLVFNFSLLPFFYNLSSVPNIFSSSIHLLLHSYILLVISNKLYSSLNYYIFRFRFSSLHNFDLSFTTSSSFSSTLHLWNEANRFYPVTRTSPHLLHLSIPFISIKGSRKPRRYASSFINSKATVMHSPATDGDDRRP